MSESSPRSIRQFPSAALWLPVLLACIVVGAAVPMLLVSDDSDIRATSQLELTEQVGWPFYGAVRQRVFAEAESLDAASFFPDTVEDFMVEVPADETWLDIIVVGSDPDVLLASADELNAHLLDAVNSGAVEIAAADEAIVVASLETLEAERTELDAQIASASEDEGFFDAAYRTSQSAGTPDPDLLASLREAQDRMSTTRRERDAAIDQIGRLERELLEIQRLTTGTLPVVRELRPASIEPFEDSPRTFAAILGGMTGLVVGVLLARSIHSVSARVRDERSIAEIVGVPVIPLADAEIPVRIVEEAKAGPLAVAGSEPAIAALVGTLESFLESDDLLVLDRSDLSVSSRNDATVEAQAVADAQADREVVLLDASHLGSAWSQLSMQMSTATFVVLRRGERSAGQIDRFVHEVRSRASTPVRVLLLPEA